MTTTYIDIRPVATSYRGVVFRSRLEARWAIFFDGIAVQWMYEPERYQLGSGREYLPDFYLPSLRFHAEVKPTAEEWDTKADVYLEFDDRPPPNSRGLLPLIGTPGPPAFNECGAATNGTAKVCLWAKGILCRELLVTADRAWREAVSAKF